MVQNNCLQYSKNKVLGVWGGKMQKIKIGFTSAPIFSNNMGCNALTYGSLEILSEVARKLNVEFEYYLLGNPSSGIIPPELKSFKIQFVGQLPDFSIKGLLRCAYHRNYQQMRHYAELLAQADIFIDNGWGDSFSDIYGQVRFETVLSHYNYAVKCGKPLILFPQTIGPFKAEKVRKQAREILKKADAVFARDPLSVQCAKELVPDLDVFETIDVAMFMPYTKRRVSDTQGLKIGINPSGLLWRGGYTGQNQFGLKADYPTVMRELINYLLSIENATIELIGHDVSGPNAGDGAEDYYICKLLQREFPACSVGPFFYSPVEAKSYISGLDMLIGSRMHCCIAAYSSGVPVFPLAYSRKFKGLFIEKLGYKYLSNLDTDGCNEILTTAKNFIEKIFEIREGFNERLKKITDYKNELIEYMALKMVECLPKYIR
jgi:polysaccharide pyruvyl transferase WcaK-like protein